MNLDKYIDIESHWHNVTTYERSNDTGDNLTATMTNFTKINDASENQSWSLATFFQIAVPLVAGTILLPLVLGNIIRALHFYRV